ncbi:ERF family protein [Carnobacterium divergens]|uniref:ERF family protein n=1 Tax=Carnobacterium divergens TaxID=2748 RepID=UPI0007F4595B|nr:ERF family protein [Carnobacterium divergens]SBO18633.1 Putative phage essential recombination function protein [Carnobacterium divergens]
MTEKTFTEKLITVQCDLKAPKGQRNDYGKYNYRSAEDIVNAVKPLNKEQGLLLTLSDKMILIGDRYYVEATATITDGETSQNYTAYAREAAAKKGMDESQITGTASSYARKYALNGLYLIDDTKDADTNEYKQQENNVKKINKKQKEELERNFSKIADLRKISTKSVEASYLSLIHFNGKIEDLDTDSHYSLLKKTEEKISNIEKEKLSEINRDIEADS